MYSNYWFYIIWRCTIIEVAKALHSTNLTMSKWPKQLKVPNLFFKDFKTFLNCKRLWQRPNSYPDAQQHCIPVHHNKLEGFRPSLFRRNTHSTPQSFLDLGYFSGAYFHGYRIYGHWASPGSSSSLHYPQHLVLFPWKNTKGLSLQSLNIQVCLGWEAHGFLFGIHTIRSKSPGKVAENAKVGVSKNK